MTQRILGVTEIHRTDRCKVIKGVVFLKVLYLITGTASLVAIADLPFGYYELLRWLITVAGIALAIQSYNGNSRGWLFLAIPAVALWNPFFGATMAKSSWLVLNLAAGVGFISASRSDQLFD